MWRFISNLAITPLTYIIEVVFGIFSRLLGNYGLAIIGVSLAVQILVLPLYKRSDEIQAKERAKQKSMEKWVKHIRRTFSGNERFMMISAYYKEQNYKPFYALRSSVSLLLQIPFFMAAYGFLSNLQCLDGYSFLFLRDLLKPDALFRIGGFTVNIMPILMTVINIASGLIYAKDLPLKDKIQLFGMAGIFLVLLYGSPSGLVLYWTMNNVFSLLKNIFMKVLKDPKRTVRRALVLVGVAIVAFTISKISTFILSKILLCLFVALACFAPEAYALIAPHLPKRGRVPMEEDDHLGRTFLITGFLLSFIMGALVPLSVVSSSPEEFIRETYGPLRLVVDSLAVSLGFFVVWGGVFFSLATRPFKRVFLNVYLMLVGLFLVDFFIFGKNTLMISPQLVFEGLMVHEKSRILLNAVLALVGMLVLPVLYRLSRKATRYLVPIILLSVMALGGVWATQVYSGAYPITRSDEPPEHRIIGLSRGGRNVVLFMLDRALSGYLPYIAEELPEVKEALSEFTYYPNTMSFGGYTNFAAPALFGGYEYTPQEINRRSEETLSKKHNEAISVLPVLFSRNGYEVTVCDPPYAGYSWIPDLSIYDGHEGITAHALVGKFDSDEVSKDFSESDHTRSMFFYSLMKCCPLFLSTTIYDDGTYFSVKGYQDNYALNAALAALQNLPRVTEVEDSDANTFLMIQNNTPHEPLILSYPDYTMPRPGDDLRSDPRFRTLADGSRLDLSSDLALEHYDVNAVAMIMVSRWIEFLKENGVYDNTRIIIVSDHGRYIDNMDRMMLSNGINVMCYNPLLLVKDYKDSGNNPSGGMRTDNAFMTNADAPILAIDGLFEDPRNPFTGKPLTNEEKFAHPQVLTTSTNAGIKGTEDLTQFKTGNGHWYSVHDDIFDVDNWTLLE